MAINSTNYSETIKQITHAMVESFGKREKYDKTFTAKITEVSDKKYKVLYCGNSYTVSSSMVCSVGDIVRVCAPCDNWLDLFVVENKTASEVKLSV